MIDHKSEGVIGKKIKNVQLIKNNIVMDRLMRLKWIGQVARMTEIRVVYKSSLNISLRNPIGE